MFTLHTILLLLNELVLKALVLCEFCVLLLLWEFVVQFICELDISSLAARL